MSTFILTNNNKALSRFHTIFNQYHDKWTMLKCHSNIVLCFSSKNYSSISDHILFDNSDFIYCSGTIFYKNRTGDDALNLIYKEFNNNYNDFKNSIIGYYTLVIYKNNSLYIFNDKYNIHDTFYNIDNNYFIIANMLHYIGCVLNKRTVLIQPLIELCLQNGLCGRYTLFKHIYRLMGFQYFQYDSRLVLGEHDYIRHYKDTKDFSITTFSDLIYEHIMEIHRIYKDHFGDDVGIFMTGGTDSKFVLSSHLAVGNRPTLLYGIGNTPLTNTREEDKHAVLKSGEIFNLDTHLMNWNSEIYVHNDTSKQYLYKYGFRYINYYGNNNLFNIINNNELPNLKALTTGFFGETIKPREWLILKDKPYVAAKDILLDYHINKDVDWNSTDFLKKYYFYQLDILRYFNKRYNIVNSLKHISKDEFEELRQIYSRGLDNNAENIFNVDYNTINTFLQPFIYDLLMSIPLKYRYNNQIATRVMKKLDPDIFRVPIYSHTRTAYRVGNHIFDPTLLNSLYRKRFIRFSPTTHKVYASIRKHLYRPKPKQTTDKYDELAQLYKEDFNNNNILNKYFSVDNFYGYLPVLYRLYSFNWALQEIGFSDIEDVSF